LLGLKRFRCASITIAGIELMHRMAGARAVGIAGGAEKCRYVAEELRFAAAVDHRAPDFAEKLAAACPKGIDVYFENIGGTIWQAVLPCSMVSRVCPSAG
jgi:NADPH-dependent curcumin reductase